MENELAYYIFLILGFLSVAGLSSVLFRKIRFPYTIGLVIIGFASGILAHQMDLRLAEEMHLTPDIILLLILPSLIFDAALHLDLKAFRRNLVPILLLAVMGLLVSTGIIGTVLSGFTALGLSSALLFGALISATDPVAVIALFNEVGAPRRLGTLLDGESIFNDATAIVLFTIILTSAGQDYASAGGLLLQSLLSFIWVLFGGLFIGSVVGAAGSLVFRLQKENSILQILSSLILAYVSFITADLLGVSGVMSTLASGIAVSLWGTSVIKHENNHTLEQFWQFFSFVANSFVFLLLGLTEASSFSNPDYLRRSLRALLIVIPVVLFARAVVIYLLIPVYNRFTHEKKIPMSFQTVIFWGGLRGAVPVALVLAIPRDFPGREIIVLATLGFILFTLLVQGTTIKMLMDRLGIKPEVSYFDYHYGLSYSLDIPTGPLLELITLRIIDEFKEEGFYAGGEGRPGSYLLNRGQKFIAVAAKERCLKITASDPVDLAYGKQIIYETVADLDQAVESIQDMVRSPDLSAIVRKGIEAEKPSDNSGLKLAPYLNPQLINTGLKSTDKEGLIRELVATAVNSGAVSDGDAVLSAVLERENSISTALENGIAIPHAKIDDIQRIVLVLGVHQEGMDFDSLDGKPSQIFFLVISPKSQVGPHIQLLTEISRKMGNESLREAVLKADSPEEVNTILSRQPGSIQS
ncbi:MAG: cation:proton antiporter [Spirochaetales bacterium]|nr:cation:proton antiporter [Spirochaetales bacterium]